MSFALKLWMDTATSKQVKRLSELSGVTRSYLYQIARGKRKASSDVAGRIETAARTLSRYEVTPGQLPRYEIAEACRNCPYAQRCAEEKENG